MRHDQLLRGLYAGIRSDPPFRDFLGALAGAVDGDAARLVIERGAAGRPLTFLSDPQAGGADAPPGDLPPGRAVTLRAWSDPAQAAAPCAARLTDPEPHNVLGLDVLGPGGSRIRLRVTRRGGDAGSDAAAKALCERLGPDLAEAAALFLQLDGTRIHRDVYAAALNRLAVGAVVVDGEGHVISMTEKAEDILRRHHLLSPGQGPWRLTGGPLRGGELSDALRRLTCPQRAAEVPWPMAVPAETGEMLNLTVRPIRCRSGRDHPLKGAALVILSEAWGPEGPAACTLSRRFGLTPAEGELAALLAQGMDLETASGLLGISKNTAKTQLRMIFAKTQVSRQSSLVRLLLRSVDELTAPGGRPAAAGAADLVPMDDAAGHGRPEAAA